MTVMTARGRASFLPCQLAALEGVAEVVFHAVERRLSDDAFIALCDGARIVGLTRRATADVSADIIIALPALRAIAVHAAGMEWVDVAALDARGIRFANLPDYCAVTVAEHAIGMLLTLSRRLHLSDRVARGELPATTSLRGWELAGKRLGLVGLGRIGSRIARLAQAFDLQVAGHDAAVGDAATVPCLSFDALLAESDIVVLACGQVRAAPPLIGADQLRRMKPGSILVNPARSGLVDTEAVIEAIRCRQLAGYAVDDRAFAPDALADIEPGRILQTAHTGWYSNEAIARGMHDWVAALVAMAMEVGDA